MKVNTNRLKENIINIGEIGKTSLGGITREAYSKEYFEALNELKELMEEQGLDVKVDRVGNLFGRRKGSKDLPAIMIGSHLDTVKNGGLLDGNLGVISALECIYVLNENKIITNHPIEIVAFNAEEGSEMGGTFGSRVMVGRQNINEEGLFEKLAKYNMTLRNIEESVKDPKEIKAFLELHIEQGGNLESKNIPIGVVNGIAGITRYKITVKGEANHAGTTPMSLRKDALTMAAKLILKIDEISKAMGDPFVSTIGFIKANPGSINVIPGEVELVLEMRDLEKEKIEIVFKKIEDYTKTILDYEFIFEFLIDKPPVRTNEVITKFIEQVCVDKGIKYEVMASGAGHDAKEIANKIPTGMIFIPSKGGKSHCPEEFTKWDDISLGAQVLLDSIIRVDRDME
ncbi:MAG: M20 family metallo-hydrolase [Sedimentibacter sp.]